MQNHHPFPSATLANPEQAHLLMNQGEQDSVLAPAQQLSQPISVNSFSNELFMIRAPSELKSKL